MKKNHRFILPASLLILTLGGGGHFSRAADRTAGEMILDGAVLHYDASDAASLVFNIVTNDGAVVTNVTKWANRGTGGETYDAADETADGWEPPRYTGGRVDFGPVGTKRDMTFQEVSGIRAVFWVIDIDLDKNAFLLGHSKHYDFHRGDDGTYFYTRAGNNVRARFGTFWDNGEKVPEPAKTQIPTGQRVISFIAGENQWPRANSLTHDRNEDDCCGGRKLAELAIFNEALSEADCRAVEGHLIEKWKTKLSHPPRALVWSPGIGAGGAVCEGVWTAGDESEKPWTAGEPPADAFFRNGDSVTFGGLGEGRGPAVVNVSGQVFPGAVSFTAAADGTVYLLRPGAASAGLVVTGAFDVAGTVTNGVPGSIGGPVTLAAGGTLALAPGGDAEQTVSGEISGAGSLVKAGGGTVEITGGIGGGGRLAVVGGTLVLNARNQSSAESPLFVGPGATIRFKGGAGDRMGAGARVLCDGGVVAFYADKGQLFPDQEGAGGRADFVLTNNALLEVEYGDKSRVGVLALHDSRILHPDTWGETRIDADSIVAGGVSSAAYSDRDHFGRKGKDMIQVRDEIRVLAGGRFDVRVKMVGGGGGLVKTGPGTLVAGEGALFSGGLAVNEGALRIPQTPGEFGGAVTFASGTEIDLSGRADAYEWGAGLAVPAGARVAVRAWDAVKAGGVLMTWEYGHGPAGEFSLVGRDSFSLRKTATALEILSGTVIIIR